MPLREARREEKAEKEIHRKQPYAVRGLGPASLDSMRRLESGAETKLSNKQEAQGSAVPRGFLQMRFRWRFADCFLLGVFVEAVFGNNFFYLRPDGGSTIDRH